MVDVASRRGEKVRARKPEAERRKGGKGERQGGRAVQAVCDAT
jgi:hypothetical protein